MCHKVIIIIVIIVIIVIIDIVIIIKSSLKDSIRERAISAADVAGFVVVVNARVTHQRKSAGETRVGRKVGAVVKASITRNTQAVFVFVEFLHSLFRCKFEPGFVGLRRRHRRRAGGSSSSSPVAGSNSLLGHRSSFVRVSLSQVTTITSNGEKVFQFYSVDSVNGKNTIKIVKRWVDT